MPATSLPIPLASPHDLFAKLKRDAALLIEDEVSSDRFFNFVITGYSLIDWVKADPAFTHVLPQTLYGNKWLKVCGDLATASKHFHITRRQPITRSSSSFQGYGAGRYGRGGFGVGEESIEIVLNDGGVINCLELVEEVLHVWTDVFAPV